MQDWWMNSFLYPVNKSFSLRLRTKKSNNIKVNSCPSTILDRFINNILWWSSMKSNLLHHWNQDLRVVDLNSPPFLYCLFFHFLVIVGLSLSLNCLPFCGIMQICFKIKENVSEFGDDGIQFDFTSQLCSP